MFLSEYSSPRCKYFVAVGAGVAVVFDALVDDLDVPVQMALLAKHLLAYGTRGWFVDLNVKMNLEKENYLVEK